MLRILLFAYALSLSSGCGDGTVCFGGNCGGADDKEKTVVASGNLFSVLPPNPLRDIMVFIYTGLDGDDRDDGPPFEVFKDADATTIGDDGTFEISRLSRGGLTVIFARDAEAEPNGVIDDGDECSVLLDRGSLSDVPGGRRIILEDLRVEFASSSCPSAPLASGCGCTRADRITVQVDRDEDSDD